MGKNDSLMEERVVIHVIQKFFGYWPYFILSLIIFLTGAFIYMKWSTPIYLAKATLVIKDEKKGTDDSKIMESLNLIGTKKILENEMEVLQSRKLMESVVIQLGLYAPLYKVGDLYNSLRYADRPFNIFLQNPDKISEVKKIAVAFDTVSKQIVMNHKKIGGLNKWLETEYGLMQFVPNERKFNLLQTTSTYFSLIPPKKVARNLLKNLSVTSVNKLSSIISLSYKDEDGERAEDILNKLLFFYEKASLEEKNILAKKTLNFVNERLNSVAHDLDSIEKDIQQYKSQENVTELGSQGQLFLQNVSSNDQELGKLNMQIGVLNQVGNTIFSGSRDSSVMMSSTMGLSDPTLSGLMVDLKSKELEYEKLRKTVAENNPMLLSIKNQIEKLRPTIAANIKGEKSNLELSRSNLMAENGKYYSLLNAMPSKEKKLLQISRDQNIKSGIYSFLLQKKEESELTYASTLSDSRVVNYAEASQNPVSPNGWIVYPSSILSSFLLVMLLISGREIVNRNILYRKEIESFTQLPIIAEVAYNKQQLMIEKNQRSFVAEEFRKIRVALHFLGIDKTKKRIVISSSLSGDGKSYIAANLAMSNAMAGKKVILLDLDLHHQGLNDVIKPASNQKGIADFLLGKSTLDEIIIPSPQLPNLYFAPSGSVQTHPSELLLNDRLEDLLSILDSRFDLLIIDTPPIYLITDAFMISKLCDATIFIIRHNHTPQFMIRNLDKQLEINSLKNPAIIFNGVKKIGFSKTFYGQGIHKSYSKNYYQE